MDLTRREATESLLGLAVAGGLGGFPGLAAPERVDMGHIRYIEASVQRLYAHDQAVGGGMLFRTALRQLARVRLMLDESDYSERIRQRLITAAGELAAATGWLCYDAGPRHWEMAHTLYGEALMYARLADDDHLMVLVLDDMALYSCGLARRSPGRARHALHLMATAKDIARPWATPRVLALLEIRTMRAYAILGDELGHRQALTRVHREFDRGINPADPNWVDFINEHELRALSALSHLDLGRAEQAADELRQVLQVPELPARNRAYYSARLSSTLAKAGDVTGACQAGVATLPLLSGVGSGRTLTELRSVRDSVAGQPAASEFCEALNAITIWGAARA